jgi:hypothetical protein
MCYKIASNFIPNKEGLFYIFPFVLNMFHSSSQWVPINIKKIIMRGSHKMVTKRVLVTIRGGGTKKGKKKRGGGGKGKTLW